MLLCLKHGSRIGGVCPIRGLHSSLQGVQVPTSARRVLTAGCVDQSQNAATDTACCKRAAYLRLSGPGAGRPNDEALNKKRLSLSLPRPSVLLGYSVSVLFHSLFCEKGVLQSSLNASPMTPSRGVLCVSLAGYSALAVLRSVGCLSDEAQDSCLSGGAPILISAALC